MDNRFQVLSRLLRKTRSKRIAHCVTDSKLNYSVLVSRSHCIYFTHYHTFYEDLHYDSFVSVVLYASETRTVLASDTIPHEVPNTT